MRYKFTETEMNELYKKIVMLVDTREQENHHVTNWFTRNKIPFKTQKLDYGDYSAMLPAGSFKGQTRDIYFTNDLVIERKFCIDELAMNLKDKKKNINEINQEIIDLLGKKYLEKVLKSDYVRIKQELTSLNKYGIEFYIFLEDKNFDKNIRTPGAFRAQYDPELLYKRLKGLEREFHTIIRPIDVGFMGEEIYNTLKYGIRNIFIHKGYIDEEVFDVG